MALKSLEDAKRDVSRRYIGRAGIHGVGIRPTGKAICVYLDSPDENSWPQVWADIRKLAYPYDVITVKSAPPSFSSKIARWLSR